MQGLYINIFARGFDFARAIISVNKAFQLCVIHVSLASKAIRGCQTVFKPFKTTSNIRSKSSNIGNCTYKKL